jgi:hypothetical protein
MRDALSSSHSGSLEIDDDDGISFLLARGVDPKQKPENFSAEGALE